MAELLRNAIAGIFRSLPNFRGKWRLACWTDNIFKQKNNKTIDIALKDKIMVRLETKSEIDRVLYYMGEYDKAHIQNICRWKKDGLVFFDVGANIGVYSLVVGRRCSASGAQIYAFEPVKENFARLEENIRMNNLDGIVFPFCLALRAKKGTAYYNIYSPEGATTGNACLHSVSFTGSIEAEVADLDSFCAARSIKNCDVIKADIEGDEMFFLLGAERTIKSARPLIIIELNCKIMHQKNWDAEDLLRFADNVGYGVWIFGKGKLERKTISNLNNFNIAYLIPAEIPVSVIRKISGL